MKQTSIAIVLLGALGDVVRAFAILPPLKEAFRDCHITWIVEPKSAGIVRLNPYVDTVIEFKRPYSGSIVAKAVKSLSAYQTFKKDIEGKFFDVVLDLQRHLKSGILSRSIPAQRRIGFNRADSKEYNWLFNTDHIPQCDPKISKVYHYLQFLPLLGVENNKNVSFGLSKAVTISDAPLSVQNIAKNSQPIIGMIMGSTWETKDWTIYGYVRLIELLLKDSSLGCSIILLGDKTQAVLANRIVELISSRGNVSKNNLLSLAGATTLKELLAILSVCSVAAGPDSGPGHISAALGVPYVGLFGPTTEERVAPFGQENRVVRVSLKCTPCMKRVCPGFGNICMSLISAEQVRDKILAALMTNDSDSVSEKLACYTSGDSFYA
jgi:heptosyltransferase-1